MKTDKYTKFILSVIAICLVVIVAKNINLIPEAHANNAPLTITQPNYGLVPLNDDGSITVKLSPTERMDVSIVDISTTDVLDINIKEIGGSYMSYGNPIPVKIKD